MTDRTTVFADALVSVSLRDGVVHLEFGEREVAPEGDGGGANAARTLVPRYRVVMPLAGFERSMRMLQDMLDHLRKQARERQEGGEHREAGPAPAGTSTDDPFVAEATGDRTSGETPGGDG